jgi:hypothetical protein
MLAAEKVVPQEMRKEDAMRLLCEIFFCLERFLAQARADKYYTKINSDDADRMIAAKAFLVQSGMVPIKRAVMNRRFSQ